MQIHKDLEVELFNVYEKEKQRVFNTIINFGISRWSGLNPWLRFPRLQSDNLDSNDLGRKVQIRFNIQSSFLHFSKIFFILNKNIVTSRSNLLCILTITIIKFTLRYRNKSLIKKILHPPDYNKLPIFNITDIPFGAVTSRRKNRRKLPSPLPS